MVFPPAGWRRHRFPPAPRRRRALQHSRGRATATKAADFGHLSLLFQAGISGMLPSRLCTASEPGVHQPSHPGAAAERFVTACVPPESLQ